MGVNMPKYETQSVEKSANPLSFDRVFIARSRLGPLRSLGPELHHEEHKCIDANDEHKDNTNVPPSIVVLVKIQGPQVIASRSVLAHTAVGSVIRVEEIRTRPHALLIDF